MKNKIIMRFTAVALAILVTSTSAVAVMAAPGNGRQMQGPGNGQEMQGPGNGQEMQGPGNGQEMQGPGNGQEMQGPGNGQEMQGPGSGQEMQSPGMENGGQSNMIRPLDGAPEVPEGETVQKPEGLPDLPEGSENTERPGNFGTDFGGRQNGDTQKAPEGDEGQMPSDGQRTGREGQMPQPKDLPEGALNVGAVNKAIDQMEDGDEKTNLKSLLKAYTDVLGDPGEKSENDEDAVKAAQDALKEAIDDAGLEIPEEGNLSDMPSMERSDRPDPGSMSAPDGSVKTPEDIQESRSDSDNSSNENIFRRTAASLGNRLESFYNWLKDLFE